MKIFSNIVAVAGLVSGLTASFAAPGEVLLLSSTISGGAGSVEAQAAVLAGKTPVVVTPATWLAMTAADFASYDALIIGDPTCTTDQNTLQAAVATATVWGPVLSGNVIIIGSDPTFHYSSQAGAQTLVRQGVAFSVAEANKTGAYITLSCDYHFSGSGTAVPLLDGLNGGGFSVIGASSLPGLNNVHIVATHPALSGLTDASLSNWGNSVHEGFNSWPVQFDVLAIARDARGSFTATDGTVGFPYILARGQQLVVISDIHVTPESARNPVGSQHTVTATVTENGTPVSGVSVTFNILAGPHAGTTATGTTDASGQVTFTYTGTSAGTDFIQASFVDRLGRRQSSNKATKEWLAAAPTVTAAPAANRGYYLLTATSTLYVPGDLKIFVKDSASAFVAGPFSSGTVVRLKKALSTGTGPGVGVASVSIMLIGNGVVYAEDPAGQVSASVTCRPL